LSTCQLESQSAIDRGIQWLSSTFPKHSELLDWYVTFAFSVLSVDQEFYDCVLDSSKQWKLMADEGIVFRAGMIQELIMVRDGLLCMSTDDFTHNDVLALTEHLCVD